MVVVHIAAECYPVAKVGGLGDVVGALPKYQTVAGLKVSVVMPRYNTVSIEEDQLECVYSGFVKLGSFNFPFAVQKETTKTLGFDLYLVDVPELFNREQIYGYEDDIERFLAFQIATLDWLITKTEIPAVIHCHDHHTGLVPFMMQHAFKYEKLRNIPTVFTAHSALYQGQFGFEKLFYLPDFDLAKVSVLEWSNRINSLATALKCATQVTTVSPNYLSEINVFGYGLESLFQLVSAKSTGILNGIDTQIWNPATDKMLETNYGVKTVVKGKQENKEKLCALFDLDATKPLFSFIGRLLNEKGADLLPNVVAMALSEHFKAINILVLGAGNSSIENNLKHLAATFKGNYNLSIGYDEILAHQMYAGSDFILMPSRVEPCGLNQMYAFRYGTVPIVRRTGGLKDTVIDMGDEGNGICHDQASAEDVCYSIQRALSLYKDKKSLNKLRKIGMTTDHSWASVCQKYIKIYQLILN